LADYLSHHASDIAARACYASEAMLDPAPETVAKHLIDLLGGHDKAFERFDSEHKQFLDIWNQDADAIGKILRAHLFVEHFMTELLRTENPNLEDLDKARLTFAQKVALIKTESFLIKELLPGIIRLNKIRNRLAHSIHAKMTCEDVSIFLSAKMFCAMRDVQNKEINKQSSADPINIIEDFALYTGNIMHAHSSGFSATWAEALRLAKEEASSASTN